MNGQDNLELYEERERELLERLGRMSADDPNRKSVVQELNTLSSIQVNYQQTELTRLNNNAKNDIDEERLRVEAEKVKNDKTRNWTTVGVSFFSMLLGYLTIHKSYHMDDEGYSFKDLKKYGQDLITRFRTK